MKKLGAGRNPGAWFLYFFLKQSMMVAVPVKHSEAPGLKTGLGISLRIEFYHLDPIGGDIGGEGYIMLFCHGVGEGDIPFVLHFFDGYSMVIVTFLCFQWRQRDAAAADHRISGAVQHISANGANIELGTEHIGRGVLVNDLLAAHQFDNGDIQRLGQRLQQGNVR